MPRLLCPPLSQSSPGASLQANLLGAGRPGAGKWSLGAEEGRWAGLSAHWPVSAVLDPRPHIPSAIQARKGPVPSWNLKDPVHRFESERFGRESVVKVPGFSHSPS